MNHRNLFGSQREPSATPSFEAERAQRPSAEPVFRAEPPSRPSRSNSREGGLVDSLPRRPKTIELQRRDRAPESY